MAFFGLSALIWRSYQIHFEGNNFPFSPKWNHCHDYQLQRVSYAHTHCAHFALSLRNSIIVAVIKSFPINISLMNYQNKRAFVWVQCTHTHNVEQLISDWIFDKIQAKTRAMGIIAEDTLNVLTTYPILNNVKQPIIINFYFSLKMKYHSVKSQWIVHENHTINLHNCIAVIRRRFVVIFVYRLHFVWIFKIFYVVTRPTRNQKYCIIHRWQHISARVSVLTPIHRQLSYRYA